MNKALAIGVIIIFLVEEFRIDQLKTTLDNSDHELMIEYRELYWAANSKVKHADSLLNSGMIINLSNLK